MDDRTQAEVAFDGAEGGLSRGQLDVPTPGLGWVAFGAVGSPQDDVAGSKGSASGLPAAGDLQGAGVTMFVFENADFEDADSPSRERVTARRLGVGERLPLEEVLVTSFRCGLRTPREGKACRGR